MTAESKDIWWLLLFLSHQQNSGRIQSNEYNIFLFNLCPYCEKLKEIPFLVRKLLP